MTTMLEKMALEITVETQCDPTTAKAAARAALQAIREPSEGALDAVEPSYSNPYGSEGPYGGGPFGDARPPIADIWRDMIDAILNEAAPQHPAPQPPPDPTR